MTTARPLMLAGHAVLLTVVMFVVGHKTNHDPLIIAAVAMAYIGGVSFAHSKGRNA